MNSFFALMFRQKYIKRWGLMRSVIEENLASHCAETAILTHALATIGNTVFNKNYDVGKAVSLALFHDAAEVVTGDLPTPVKYFNPQMRASYSELERNAVSMLLSQLPDELIPSYKPLLEAEGGECELNKLVKAADKICAYIKCIEEQKNGNTEFRQARISISKALAEFDCEEMDWFIKNLLPSFELTLDEM